MRLRTLHKRAKRNKSKPQVIWWNAVAVAPADSIKLMTPDGQEIKITSVGVLGAEVIEEKE